MKGQSVKKMFIAFVAIFFVLQPVVCQSDDHAILIIHRLKKTTNSDEHYSFWINEKYLGSTKGLTSILFQDGREVWLFTKTADVGEQELIVTKDKKLLDMNNTLLVLGEDDEVKDRLAIDLKPGGIYFITFDPSAAYGVNSLNQTPYKKGYQTYKYSKKKNVEYKYSDLRSLKLEPDPPEVKSMSASRQIGNAQVKVTKPLIKEGFKTIINENSVTLNGKVYSKEGIKKVKVNGKEIMFQDNGYFSTTVPLTVGDNIISIHVVDNENSVTVKNLSLTRGYSAGDEDFDLYQTSGKYYALLIAIEDYSDTRINNLDKPIEDAERLKRTLTTYYTFDEENITVLKNPTRSDIIIELDNISNTITENDNLLIFYAGHGYWDEEKKLGYWLPADAQKANTANWLRNSTLSDYIGSIKAKHTLLIADACFSGGIFKTRSAFNSPDKAINKLYQLPSRKAMTSGTLTEVPDQSAFLEYLNKRLEQNDNPYLTSESLFISFRTPVLNNSPTIPQYGTIQNSGDEGGEFVFIKRR